MGRSSESVVAVDVESPCRHLRALPRPAPVSVTCSCLSPSLSFSHPGQREKYRYPSNGGASACNLQHVHDHGSIAVLFSTVFVFCVKAPCLT